MVDWSKTCSVEGCGKSPVVAKGFCRRHYQRWHRYGNPEEPLKRPIETLTWLKEQIATRDRDEGCWEWPFGKTGRGYGEIYFQGKRIRAHNAALILDGYPEPAAPNNFGLHSCDNPPCFNPSHLRWGSHKDNCADAVERNRMRRGETIPWAKLKDEDIPKIRADQRTHEAIGADYGVAKWVIQSVKCGRTWRHVDG